MPSDVRLFQCPGLAAINCTVDANGVDVGLLLVAQHASTASRVELVDRDNADNTLLVFLPPSLLPGLHYEINFHRCPF